MPEVKERFPGLETEIPEDMDPTARTIAALVALEKHNVVYLQFDDGSDDFETAKQLREIAGNVGYELLWVKEPYVAYLISRNVCEV